MPLIQRWIFFDPHSSETWTVPINPNSMTDPEAKTRNFTFGVRSRSSSLPNVDAIRGIEAPADPVDWEFGGVIYRQEHHDTLQYWAEKPKDIHITDHFGRTWSVVMKTFEPTERQPTTLKPWRFTYEMHGLILGRVVVVP